MKYSISVSNVESLLRKVMRLWSLRRVSLRRLLKPVLCIGIMFITPVYAHAQMRTPIPQAKEAINIDASASESAWQKGAWRKVDQVYIGDNITPEDFTGRYKLLWDEAALYMLLEITDDVLIDTHSDPLVKYWDDDCVEIFVDENGSGGNHEFTYNAFAYHVGLDRNVSDMGPTSTSSESKVQVYNEHVQSQWVRSPETQVITWELKIALFDDTFLPATGAKPSQLRKNKEIGFMFAYCDADKAVEGKSTREHFIGSYPIEDINGDKNLGYKDASVFEPMILK
nr:sugar-binding protein [uncultured Glaciecola sp.]